MGRIAGENKIYGYGILKNNCPDFIKIELGQKTLNYSDKDFSDSNSIPLTVDISNLSDESKYYLKLKEICKKDKFSSVDQDATNLVTFLKNFVEAYEESLGITKKLIIGKSILVQGLVEIRFEDKELLEIKHQELRAQLKTIELLISGLLEGLAEAKP